MKLTRPSRRSFLGGLLSGMALAPGLSWASSGDRQLLVITAAGGWDVTYTFDPKVGIPHIDGPEVDLTHLTDDVEAVQTIAGMPLMVNPRKRPAVTAFFEKWGHRTAIVNGIWVGAIGHPTCTVRILTGTPSDKRPDISVIAGNELVGDRPLGSVDFSGFGFSGPLGVTHGAMGARGQARALVERSAALPRPDGTTSTVLPDAAQVAIDEHVRRRIAAVAGASRHNPAAQQQLADLAESLDRSQILRDQGLPLDRLGVGQEATPGTLGLTLVDLLERNVCRTAMMDSSFHWDTHYGTSTQHTNYEATFADLHVLIDELEARGMLDRVLVCVISEMTRTPLVNALGGKDHWPHTSALFIGGGVVGGRVRGATDDYLESLPVDLATGAVDPAGELLRYDNLAAGLLDHLGVDAERWFPGITPFRGLAV